MKVEVHVLYDVPDAKDYTEAVKAVARRTSSLHAGLPKSAPKVQRTAQLEACVVRPALKGKAVDDKTKKLTDKLFAVMEIDEAYNEDYDKIQGVLVELGFIEKPEEIDNREFNKLYSRDGSEEQGDF